MSQTCKKDRKFSVGIQMASYKLWEVTFEKELARLRFRATEEIQDISNQERHLHEIFPWRLHVLWSFWFTICLMFPSYSMLFSDMTKFLDLMSLCSLFFLLALSFFISHFSATPPKKRTYLLHQTANIT